jgi:hypothetical protein
MTVCWARACGTPRPRSSRYNDLLKRARAAPICKIMPIPVTRPATAPSCPAFSCEVCS